MEFAKQRLVIALVAVAAAVLLPGAAGAATAPAAKQTTVKGVVVARERARGTLVVASSGGAVETLRTRAAQPVGSRISARATRLADGTYRAATVSRVGSAHRARVHGVVVAAKRARVLVSAGGSVFAIDRARSVAAVGGGSDVQPGEIVNATVSIDSQTGSLDESSLQQAGQASLVKLEGTISSLASGTLVLAVEDGGALTTIAVPTGLTLPSTIAAGDRVEVLTQFAGGTFTLVSIQDDQAAAQSGSGVSSSGEDQQSDEVEAEGLVTAVTPSSSSGPGSLTVQPEEGSPVTFVVPSGVDVSAVAVGDHVHAKGAVQPGGTTITLVRLEVQGGEEHAQQAGEVEAEGTVTALGNGSLTVQPKDGGSPVTFVVPTGFDLSGATTGSVVDAKGTQSGTTTTLTELEVQGVESSGQQSGATDQQQSGGSEQQSSGTSGSGGDSGNG